MSPALAVIVTLPWCAVMLSVVEAVIPAPAVNVTFWAAETWLWSLREIELVEIVGVQPRAGVVQPASQVTLPPWAVTGDEAVTLIDPVARNTPSAPAVTGALVVTVIPPPLAFSVTVPCVA